MIDLTIHPEALERNIEVARKNHIILPTFEQMKHPELVPEKVKEALLKAHREDLIGSGPKCLIRAIPPRTDKPSAPPPKAPPKAPIKGKKPLPKGNIPKPSAPKGAVKKAAPKAGKRK